MIFKKKLIPVKFEKRYKRFFADVVNNGKKLVTHCPNSGSMLGLTKRIVDLVSTGKTLEENGLSEVEKIMDISSFLIVNRNISKAKPEKIREIINRFRKVANVKNY